MFWTICLLPAEWLTCLSLYAEFVLQCNVTAFSMALAICLHLVVNLWSVTQRCRNCQWQPGRRATLSGCPRERERSWNSLCSLSGSDRFWPDGSFHTQNDCGNRKIHPTICGHIKDLLGISLWPVPTLGLPTENLHPRAFGWDGKVLRFNTDRQRSPTQLLHHSPSSAGWGTGRKWKGRKSKKNTKQNKTQTKPCSLMKGKKKRLCGS